MGKTWKVTINFATYIGCDEEYEVYAETRLEAEEEAMQMAINDLDIVEVTCEDDEDEDEEDEDDE